MLIDDLLLDALASEAQASPRLRMNRDLRNTPTATEAPPSARYCCAAR